MTATAGAFAAALNGGQFLAQVGVQVGADDAVTTGLGGIHALSGGLLNERLRVTFGQSSSEAALALDFLEQRPGLGGQFNRERFHIVGTAGRIDDASQLTLLVEDDLDVTRQTAREVITRTNHFVKSADLQPGATADDASERLGGRAQEIGVLIEHGLVPPRGAAVADETLSLGRATGSLDGARPEQASRAQLGNFHEQVGTQRVREQETRRRLVDREPAFIHRTQILNASSETEGEFLHGICPHLGPKRSIHAEGAKRQTVLANGALELGHFVVGLFQRHR